MTKRISETQASTIFLEFIVFFCYLYFLFNLEIVNSFFFNNNHLVNNDTFRYFPFLIQIFETNELVHIQLAFKYKISL